MTTRKYTVGSMLAWSRMIRIYLKGKKFSFLQYNSGCSTLPVVDCTRIASHFSDKRRPNEEQAAKVKEAAIERAKYLAKKLGWCLLLINNVQVTYRSKDWSVEDIKKISYPSSLANSTFRLV